MSGYFYAETEPINLKNLTVYWGVFDNSTMALTETICAYQTHPNNIKCRSLLHHL